MLLLKSKTKNIKLYLIEKNYSQNFLKAFNLKRALAFSIIKNEANEQLYCDLIEKLKLFENNSLEIIYDNENIIKEYIVDQTK